MICFYKIKASNRDQWQRKVITFIQENDNMKKKKGKGKNIKERYMRHLVTHDKNHEELNYPNTKQTSIASPCKIYTIVS